MFDVLWSAGLFLEIGYRRLFSKHLAPPTITPIPLMGGSRCHEHGVPRSGRLEVSGASDKNGGFFGNTSLAEDDSGPYSVMSSRVVWSHASLRTFHHPAGGCLMSINQHDAVMQ
jgi:hypothetical protein